MIYKEQRTKIKDQKIYRVLDANINRAREGLRVIEEVFRLVLDDQTISKELKNLRSKLQLAVKSLPNNELLLEARQAHKDVGRTVTNKTENKRSNLDSILQANMKRIQEALRVLEEFSKLVSLPASKKFKALRFKLYQAEKEIAKKLG